MRIIDPSLLLSEPFLVDAISAFPRRPEYRILGVAGRRYNGFVLFEEGNCVYRFGKERIEIAPNTLLYLPFGSQHRFSVTAAPFSFTQINFTLTDAAGESVVFSDRPLLVSHATPTETVDAIRELTSLCEQGGSLVRKTSLLYGLFDLMTSDRSRSGNEKLRPALDYLSAHYSENFPIPVLADACFLSLSHFYRLFCGEYGMTPLEYRNRMRMKRACLLLSEGDGSVSEIASLLGYDSLYSFSRAFRRTVGVSPTAFRQSGKNM